jgi:dTDP-4-dehydrorhamnose reductase
MRETRPKILVLGAAGMLGTDLLPVLSSQLEVLSASHRGSAGFAHQADVTDIVSIERLAEKFRPNYIVNLAALTDLEFCEKNPDRAYQVNSIGAGNVAAVASRFDAVCIQISTAGVFSGEKGSYHEYDQPAPVGVYGKSKLFGEQEVRTQCDRHFILRAGWLTGGGKQDKKFIAKLLEQIRAGVREIKVVEDIKGSPTFASDFAEQLCRILKLPLFGTYHVVNSGFASRYEIAQELIEILGVGKNIDLIPVNSAHFVSSHYAPRPKNETLECMRLRAQGAYLMPPWQQSLRRYLRRLDG